MPPAADAQLYSEQSTETSKTGATATTNTQNCPEREVDEQTTLFLETRSASANPYTVQEFEGQPPLQQVPAYPDASYIPYQQAISSRGNAPFIFMQVPRNASPNIVNPDLAQLLAVDGLIIANALNKTLEIERRYERDWECSEVIQMIMKATAFKIWVQSQDSKLLIIRAPMGGDKKKLLERTSFFAAAVTRSFKSDARNPAVLHFFCPHLCSSRFPRSNNVPGSEIPHGQLYLFRSLIWQLLDHFGIKFYLSSPEVSMRYIDDFKNLLCEVLNRVPQEQTIWILIHDLSLYGRSNKDEADFLLRFFCKLVDLNASPKVKILLTPPVPADTQYIVPFDPYCCMFPDRRDGLQRCRTSVVVESLERMCESRGASDFRSRGRQGRRGH